MLLGLRLDATDHLQQHADRIISHFPGALLDEAGQQRVPDRRRMRPHLAGALMGDPPLQELHDRLRDISQGVCWHPECLEGLQFGDFLLEILDSRRGWIGFEVLKRGDRLVVAHKPRHNIVYVCAE